MGVYGTFQRLTATELEALLAEPALAKPLLDRHRDTAPERPFFHLDKTWHALMYLVEKSGTSTAAIFGSAEIEVPRPPIGEFMTIENLGEENYQAIIDQLGVAPEDVDWVSDDDQPTFLTPAEVSAAAQILAETPAHRLADAYDPADMITRDIYPEGIWTRPDEDNLSWILAYVDGLASYFAQAATAGDAMLFWVE